MKFLSGKNIRIINYERKEELITAANGPKLNEQGSHVFTDRTKQEIITDNQNYWTLEKVPGKIKFNNPYFFQWKSSQIFK